MEVWNPAALIRLSSYAFLFPHVVPWGHPFATVSRRRRLLLLLLPPHCFPNISHSSFVSSISRFLSSPRVVWPVLWIADGSCRALPREKRRRVDRLLLDLSLSDVSALPWCSDSAQMLVDFTCPLHDRHGGAQRPSGCRGIKELQLKKCATVTTVIGMKRCRDVKCGYKYWMELVSR